MKKAITLIIVSILIFGCTKINPTKEIFETIIIGGGLMGSSTAWHLSDQGNEILLLEKQDSIYTQGSSFGEARIARSSNRGNDIWSYLHNNSVVETQKLISYLQNVDTSQTYKIEDLYTTSPVTYVGRTKIYDQLYASLIRQNIDYQMATTLEEGKSMFNVTLPDSVLIQREYNNLSGTLNPRKLISYLHGAVVNKGNEIYYNTKATNINFNAKSDLYEIETKNEKTGNIKEFYAKNVIAAAGPYTGKLLKNIAPYFDTLIDPQRVFLAFLRIKKESYLKLTDEEKEKIQSFYPVINSSKGTRDGSFFSMIEYFNNDGSPVIKIGGHFQRTEIGNLDSIWEKSLTESEIDWSITNTSDYLKLLNLPISKDEVEYIKGYSCVYSLTETEVPYVAPILNEGNSPNERFIVLGGMSGVGAKGAMTYGLIAADILNNRSNNDSLYNLVKMELGFDRLKAILRN